MNVVICGGYIVARRRFGQCYGACDIADAPIIETEGSPYYGYDATCLACGDGWSDEGLAYRPFRPRWRQDSIARGSALWDLACDCKVQRDDDCYPIPCEHDLARRAA